MTPFGCETRAAAQASSEHPKVRSEGGEGAPRCGILHMTRKRPVLVLQNFHSALLTFTWRTPALFTLTPSATPSLRRLAANPPHRY
ncbi:hypothetical protein E2C01_001111 [Portunus trituberculatus]|uniref:Uncharacterized protein n=1 Tax=Portunus trituberculatus TaxID=210409 RepID=A0A5B7CIJ0_PORTR|nr:hypothetical protein [Portunus trituberculatus]